ncbi:MAG: type I-C CRISPR-associated protein Cas7/Csd2 [Kiritimatiellae bacterium]|nr:type I-C CRISPR-associated protein Cas7/Csd2 [Kiritimatiellia bacterium]
MRTPIQNRYDFVFLYDCTDGNPNGDPDAANAPRLDPQTMQGLVSDVCIKRKIRNFVQLHKKGQPGFDLHVQHGMVLNNNILTACEKTDVPVFEKKEAKNRPPEQIKKLQDWLCDTFYDIRTFGSVLSTGQNAGQLKGPVQISFSRSIDPVVSIDASITRVCGTDEQKNTEMGRKALIPYGLYRCHGFVSANLAEQTKFDETDLLLLFKALCGRGIPKEDFGPSMFDDDVSAARNMSARKLVVFKHQSRLGNAPAHLLFDRVSVKRKKDVSAARAFSNYDVNVNEDGKPTNVEIITLL